MPVYVLAAQQTSESLLFVLVFCTRDSSLEVCREVLLLVCFINLGTMLL